MRYSGELLPKACLGFGKSWNERTDRMRAEQRAILKRLGRLSRYFRHSSQGDLKALEADIEVYCQVR